MTDTKLRSLVSVLRPVAAVVVAGVALTACYVVPVQQAPAYNAPAVAVAPTPVASNFLARLYPTNSEAAAYGMVTGTVTNDLNGRGHFSVVIAGEQFQGEATRVPGNMRSGVANAAGNRGGMLICRYTMNSATLGSGNCVLNGGPAFSMHVGG